MVDCYLTITLKDCSIGNPFRSSSASYAVFLENELVIGAPLDAIPPTVDGDWSYCDNGVSGVHDFHPGKTPTPPPILATLQIKQRM